MLHLSLIFGVVGPGIEPPVGVIESLPVPVVRQDVNVAALQANGWQKKLIAAIQADGFTISRAVRDVATRPLIYLDVKKGGKPDYAPIALVLDPGAVAVSGANPTPAVPPGIDSTAVAGLGKVSKEDAQILVKNLGITYPELSFKVFDDPGGAFRLRILKTFRDGEVAKSASVIQTINAMVQASEAAADFAKKNQLKPAGPTDPAGLNLVAGKLIYTDLPDFYKVRFNYAKTMRSHNVFVRKRVDNYLTLNTQEAYGLVYESKDAPSPELLQKIFKKTFLIGGMILEQPSPSQQFWRIRFRLEIPTLTTPTQVRELLELVGVTADEIEKEIGPEDKL